MPCSLQMLSIAPCCPQNAAEISSVSPFLYLCHTHTPFLFFPFQVLQTDSQSPDNMSWTFSHHYLSMAYPVPISTSQDPILFLRFKLKTEESRILDSSAAPLLSFYTALSFNKHLVPYRVRCWGISLLLQSPWEQRLFHLYPTGRPRCAVAVLKCKIPTHSQRLSALKFTTWLSSPFQRIIPLQSSTTSHLSLSSLLFLFLQV